MRTSRSSEALRHRHHRAGGSTEPSRRGMMTPTTEVASRRSDSRFLGRGSSPPARPDDSRRRAELYGAFEILAPVGTYSISYELPADKYALGALSPVELTDPRGCVEIPVAVHSDGHISGRVRDSHGGSISGLTVELVPADRQSDRFFFPRSQARTTPDGAFEITKVAPGRYVMGFNTRNNLPYPRTIFSGPDAATTARVVDVKPGERVSVGDLTVPASIELHTITGVVRDDSGQPIAGAKVYLKVPGAGFELIGEAPVTGPDGRFAIAVLNGYRYDLNAELVGKPGDSPRVRQSEWLPLSGSETSPLTLVIRR